MDKKEILRRSQKKTTSLTNFPIMWTKKPMPMPTLPFSFTAVLPHWSFSSNFISQAKLTAITAHFCFVLPLPFAVVLSSISAAIKKRKISSLC